MERDQLVSVIPLDRTYSRRFAFLRIFWFYQKATTFLLLAIFYRPALVKGPIEIVFWALPAIFLVGSMPVAAVPALLSLLFQPASWFPYEVRWRRDRLQITCAGRIEDFEPNELVYFIGPVETNNGLGGFFPFERALLVCRRRRHKPANWVVCNADELDLINWLRALDQAGAKCSRQGLSFYRPLYWVAGTTTTIAILARLLEVLVK